MGKKFRKKESLKKIFLYNHIGCQTKNLQGCSKQCKDGFVDWKKKTKQKNMCSHCYSKVGKFQSTGFLV